MSERKLFDGRFVPYRKPRGPRPPGVVKAEAELLAVTQRVNAALREGIAVAMDPGGRDGRIAFRDEAGAVWVVSIQRSDVERLRCDG